jgi:hypothetical protein
VGVLASSLPPFPGTVSWGTTFSDATHITGALAGVNPVLYPLFRMRITLVPSGLVSISGQVVWNGTASIGAFGSYACGSEFLQEAQLLNADGSPATDWGATLDQLACS